MKAVLNVLCDLVLVPIKFLLMGQSLRTKCYNCDIIVLVFFINFLCRKSYYDVLTLSNTEILACHLDLLLFAICISIIIAHICFLILLQAEQNVQCVKSYSKNN